MNIDRVNSGVIQETGSARPRINLTISDGGVSAENIKAPGAKSAQLAQVTSNSALQNVLSAEETQALIERFGNGGTGLGAGRINVYNGQGSGVAQAGAMRGALVDLVG